MDAMMKTITVRFKDILKGETFNYVGDIGIKTNPTVFINAVLLDGTILLLRDDTPVVRVKPVSIEHGVLFFDVVEKN